MTAFADDPRRIAVAREMRERGCTISQIRAAVRGGKDVVRRVVADVSAATVERRAEIRRAAVAAYGKRSMSLVAADLGVSTGAVSHWWAAAKREGLIEPLFERHDGSKFHSGRQSRGRGIATYDGERVEMVPHRYSVTLANAAPPRAAAGRGES